MPVKVVWCRSSAGKPTMAKLLDGFEDEYVRKHKITSYDVKEEHENLSIAELQVLYPLISKEDDNAELSSKPDGGTG